MGGHLGGHPESCQGTLRSAFRIARSRPRPALRKEMLCVLNFRLPLPADSRAATRQPRQKLPERRTMIELLGFISYIITLYTYIVIASVILSWLMAFGIVNPYNPTVRAIDRALSALTEPLLRPIRAHHAELGSGRYLAARPAPLLLLHPERCPSQHRQALHVMGARAPGRPGSVSLPGRLAAELPWRPGDGCVIVRVRLTPEILARRHRGRGGDARGSSLSSQRCARRRPTARPTRRSSGWWRSGSMCPRARCTSARGRARASSRSPSAGKRGCLETALQAKLEEAPDE